MGSSYSYLKIKITNYTAGFIFEEVTGIYKKITIAAGHPDNSFNNQIFTTKTNYETYGDWYYYDGDYKSLRNVLNSFNPKGDNIHFLIDRLKTECNLEKYESTWNIICSWVKNVASAISSVPVGVVATVLSFFCSSKIDSNTYLGLNSK